MAAKYIANRLQLAGIKPGNNGSYFQPVSLVGLKPDPNTVLNVSRISDGKSFTFDFGKDFVGFTDAQKDDVSVEGDLVFVGYGIDAPEQNWNDYKGDAARYKDKILVDAGERSAGDGKGTESFWRKGAYLLRTLDL